MFINSKTRAVNLSLYIYIYVNTHTHTTVQRFEISMIFFINYFIQQGHVKLITTFVIFTKKTYIFLINYVILNYLFIKEPLSNQKFY